MNKDKQQITLRIRRDRYDNWHAYYGAKDVTCGWMLDVLLRQVEREFNATHPWAQIHDGNGSIVSVPRTTLISMQFYSLWMARGRQGPCFYVTLSREQHPAHVFQPGQLYGLQQRDRYTGRTYRLDQWVVTRCTDKTVFMRAVKQPQMREVAFRVYDRCTAISTISVNYYDGEGKLTHGVFIQATGTIHYLKNNQ